MSQKQYATPFFLVAAEETQVSANISKAWEKLDSMIDGFLQLLPNICIAIVVFVLMLFAAKIAKSMIQRATRERESKNIGLVLGRLGQWVIILLGAMVAVSIVSPSVGPGEFMSALGVTSVAIGFAFKDILQNFLAGVLILLREPFKIGDVIKCGEYTGTVEAIETRSTFLKTWDGQEVIIPNGQIFTSPIEVVTARPDRRNSCTIGIGYGDDIRTAQEIILSTLKQIDGVLSDPAPFVQTVELGGSSVNLKAFWWTRNADFGSVGSEAITRMKEALDDAGIDMPFPTQVVLHHDQTVEFDGGRTRQREGWPAGEDPPRPRARVESKKALDHAGNRESVSSNA